MLIRIIFFHVFLIICLPLCCLEWDQALTVNTAQNTGISVNHWKSLGINYLYLKIILIIFKSLILNILIEDYINTSIKGPS